MSQQFLQNQTSHPHGDSIWKACWTTRNQIVSASADGGLRIWDATKLSSHPTHHLKPHRLGIVSLSIDHSGTKALTVSVEGTVYLTDLVKGKTLGKKVTSGEEIGEEGKVLSAWQVAIHPNGKTWASTGSNAQVALYTLPDQYTSSSSISPTADAENADDTAENGEKNTPMEINNDEEQQPLGDLGQCIGLVQVDGTGKAKFGMDLKYSPDGTLLAVSTESGSIVILDVETRTVVTTYPSHALPVRALAWTPDSQFLFSGSDDRRIVMHDIKAGTGTATTRGDSPHDLHGHKSWVTSLSVSEDGQSLVSGGADSTIKVWDIRDLSQKKKPISNSVVGSQVWAVAFQPSSSITGQSVTVGKAFCSGGDDNRVSLWKAAGSA